MKKLLLSFFLMASLQINAQSLLNGGFESWTVASTYYSDTLPTDWWSPMCMTVHQSTDAMVGTYATRIQGYMSCGIAPGMLINGVMPADGWSFIQSGTPYTGKPASISGGYKLIAQAGDSAEVTVILKKYNTLDMKYDTVAMGYQALAPTASYQNYTVNITDMMPGTTPDSIVIIFNFSKYYMWDTLTYELANLFLDRLVVPQTGPIGIEENELNLSSMIYPNPFSEAGTLFIDSDMSRMENLFLNIYDMSGKLARTIGPLTENTVRIEQDNLSPGVYSYTLSDNTMLQGRGRLVIR